MLTIDGSEEEEPMGVIAGSYPSYIGNLHNTFFFLSTFKTKQKKWLDWKKKFKIQRSDIFLLEVKKIQLYRIESVIESASVIENDWECVIDRAWLIECDW